MIDIPSAQSMRERSAAAKLAHEAEVIESHQTWLEAAVQYINECAAMGHTAADIPWPDSLTSYADKKILLKQFEEAGYYTGESNCAIMAKYCALSW